jgi:type I restriction enzyme S subunit
MIISPKEELTFESSIIRVRLDQEVIFPKFYFYFFASKYGSSVISPIVSGTTIKGIRASELKNIPVPLPPLPEQKAIAEVLSDTDALIESLEALIAKKRAVKQGSMQELLTGRRRLPGFAVSGRYRQTEVGVVPEEWEVVSIGTCATVIGGGTPSTRNSQYWDGQINWFTPSEVGKAKYLRESIRKISILGLKNSSAKSLPSGTILLTTRATIGETGILLNKASTNQGFQSLIPVKDKTDTEFFYYLLNTIKPKLLSLSSGSTFLELNPTKLRSITISLPPLPEQKAIAEVLSDMDAEIEALEQKRDKYKKIKQGMMDQLLTGKVRLYER